MPSPPRENHGPQQVRARQRLKIQALALLLLVGGLVVLLFLRRIPLPLRLAVGTIDVIAGLGLLVLVRQKLGPLPLTDDPGPGRPPA